MDYYNLIQPQIVCDNAIRALKNEQRRISREMENTNEEDFIKAYNKKREQLRLYFEYEDTITQLERLKEYTIQQIYKK